MIAKLAGGICRSLRVTVDAMRGSSVGAARECVPVGLQLPGQGRDQMTVTVPDPRNLEGPQAALVRIAFATLAILIIAPGLPAFWIALTQDPGEHMGTDYDLYMDAARRWLASGVFYEPYQLVGPYSIENGLMPILYPPVVLWLLVPFTLLPWPIWWTVPIVGTAWIVWSWRPGPISWPLIAICLAWEPTHIHLMSGNPGLWAMFATALATRWPFAGPFALLKPSLFPFAGVGIKHRAWWLGLGFLGLLSIAVLPMWFDWLTVLVNLSNAEGLLYSWQYAPMMLIPILASWARSRTTKSTRPRTATRG